MGHQHQQIIQSGSHHDRPNIAVSRATYLYCGIAALNSVNLGYDIGVSTNAGVLIQKDWNLSDESLEGYLGLLNLCSIFGAIVSPVLCDRCGRRNTFSIAAVIFCIGVAVTCFARVLSMLFLGRIFLGFAVGIGEAIDPMYIAELAPAHVRGSLVSWAEAGVAFGVVLGFSSSIITDNWRVMIAFGGILPIFMLYFANFVLPESPRWLLRNGHETTARAVLEQTMEHADESVVETTLDEMKVSLRFERASETTIGWAAILRPSPSVARMLLLGVGIAVLQQAVGIDSIMFYLMFVIQQSGITDHSFQTMVLILLGTVKLVFVFVGARLFDKAGRRPLLITSLLGCGASLVVVSGTFLVDHPISKIITILALSSYLAFFSTGIGPGNWVVVSEIFASSIRAKAMSVAIVPNRITSTIMSSTFLSASKLMTWPGFFMFLSMICFGGATFIFAYLPETKGRTLESMSHYFAEITGDRSILDMEARAKLFLGSNGDDESEQSCVELT